MFGNGIFFSQRWGRKYDEFGVNLRQETVNVLLALNSAQEMYQSVLYDKKFIKTIMEDIFSGEQLASNQELDPRKIEFIQGRIFV